MAQEVSLPPVEPAVMWRELNKARVGTVAAFGVEDEVIEALQVSLRRYTAVETPLVLTRMGEDVAYSIERAEENDLYLPPTLILSYRVRARADRLFFIVELSGRDAETGEATFGFINVRLDRLAGLLRFMRNKEAFNLRDYATLVECGTGMPSTAVWEKMQTDYLFGRRQVNIRIFPPLSEVT